MTRPKQADWLDQVILGAKPGVTPRADFDAWRSAHPGAIRRLRQRGAGIPRNPSLPAVILRFVRGMGRNPVVRYAVAAVVAAGILILVVSREGRQTAPVAPPVRTADRTEVLKPEKIDPAQEELHLANELFLAGDVERLLSLLHTALPRTALAALAYLGQIGDISTLPALQTFADQWQGPPEENPFQDAIHQIRRRHGQNETKPLETSQDRAVAIPTASEPLPSRREGRVQMQTYRGVVVDRAGVPVDGAVVWAQHCTKDLELTDIAGPVSTDLQGRFRLTVPVGDSEARSRTYLLCKHPRYALGWTRLPTDRENSDLADCRIILYVPTIVVGTVADTTGRPIAGALVEARIVPAHDPISAQEYPYASGNQRAVRTDASGQFVLQEVPEGSLLSLSVSCRGYASYDSREGRDHLLGTSPFIDPESYTVRAGREDVRIELMPARGGINVRIVDEHGMPYDGGATLRCEDGREDGDPLLSRSNYHLGILPFMDPSQRGTCFRESKGRFRIEDLPSGLYCVGAADPESGDLLTPPVNVVLTDAQPWADVVLRAARTAKVTVRVRRSTDEPVRGALVSVEPANRRKMVVMEVWKPTDPNGSCVFRLPEGEHRIAAWGGRTEHDSLGRIRVGSDLKDQQVDVSIATRSELRGRLVDAFGEPVRGSIRPLWRVAFVTDPDGRFATARDGTIIGLARNTEGTLARLFEIHPWSNEIEIRLEPPAIFTGRVLDPHGRPVRNALVVFRFAGFKCQAFLSDGRFRLEVPVGAILTLIASKDGYEGRSEPVDPAPGRTYNLGDILLQPEPLPPE
jgi:hypothetical protein